MKERSKPHWIIEHATKVAVGVFVAGVLGLAFTFTKQLYFDKVNFDFEFRGNSRLEDERFLVEIFTTNLGGESFSISPQFSCKTNTFDDILLNVTSDFVVPSTKTLRISYRSGLIENKHLLSSISCPLKVFDSNDNVVRTFSFYAAVGQPLLFADGP